MADESLYRLRERWVLKHPTALSAFGASSKRAGDFGSLLNTLRNAAGPPQTLSFNANLNEISMSF